MNNSFIKVFFLVIASFLFLIIENGSNKMVIWFCLIIYYFIFFKSFNKPIFIVNTVKSYLKIDTIFYLFFFIIYYYPYQLYVLGLKNFNSYRFLSYDEHINSAVLLPTIGLLAFSLGYNNSNINFSNQVFYSISKKYMRSLSLVISFFIVVILSLFVFTGGLDLFLNTYAGSKLGSVTYDAIFSLVSFFIILGALYALSNYFLEKKLGLYSIILLSLSLFWSFALLILGDRNTFFLIAICLFAGYYTFIKSISRKYIVIFLFIAIGLYNVVELTRTEKNKDLNTFIEASNTVYDQLLSDFGNENSFDITSTGVRASFKVAEDYGFYYGKFKLVSIASIIPYSSRIFIESDDQITGSSNILKKEMIGLRAGWGVGTNIISDCYLDFGILGVIIILFYFGKFGSYVTRMVKFNVNSPKWIFIYIITLSYYSELSRYGFDFPLRSIVWTFVLFYFLDKIFGLSNLNKKYTKQILN